MNDDYPWQKYFGMLLLGISCLELVYKSNAKCSFDYDFSICFVSVIFKQKFIMEAKTQIT